MHPLRAATLLPCLALAACQTPQQPPLTPTQREALESRHFDLPRDPVARAVATALLDARFLDGDEALARDLAARFRARLTEREATALARRLAADKATRHARFGDTVFLLDPAGNVVTQLGYPDPAAAPRPSGVP